MGGSGRVHRGVDSETGDDVAIKISLAGHNRAYEKELQSYQQLDGITGIPRLRWSGSKLGRGVLVMDWLPADLGRIFRECPQAFTPAVVARVAQQAMEILQRVHSKNVVHGDVKPNNFALTLSTPGIGMIYLIDFGLAQEIRKPGEHSGTRKRKVFEGNPYFASVNALRGYDLSPRDDLESLAYNLIFFICQGCMPWNYLMAFYDATQHPSPDFLSSLATCKLKASNNKASRLPDIYQELLDHARGLAYGDVPDYNRFQQAFGQLAELEEGRVSLGG
jgi:serine/threonine protein kinase